MKPVLLFLLNTLLALSANAQYYYQDLVTEKQVAEKWKLYKENRVKSVNILSFENDNKPTENFQCYQTVKSDFSQISTYTKSDLAREATITTFYGNQGQPQRTFDTSQSYRSTTEYEYDPAGNIVAVGNASLETINNIKSVEQHFWKYGADEKPLSMTKVKNGLDTTWVRLVQDEKGNIVEEHEMRNHSELQVYYYYYDNNNRLTDIVRYNEKAKRLLPDYIFTYDENGWLSSMIFVQEGSVDYNKWVYAYDEKGLRTSETCLNKHKELVGKIEYEYSFSK